MSQEKHQHEQWQRKSDSVTISVSGAGVQVLILAAWRRHYEGFQSQTWIKKSGVSRSTAHMINRAESRGKAECVGPVKKTDRLSVSQAALFTELDKDSIHGILARSISDGIYVYA